MSSSSSEIILYAVPSREGRCCSPNVWKTRMLLNYKNIAYKTRFMRMEDLQPTLSQLGVPPNDPNASIAPFTVPVVTLPSGESIMDSRQIASAIEALHPSPTVRLDDPVVARVEAFYYDIIMPLMPVWLPRMARNVVQQESLAWFYEQRKAKLGMSVDEMEAKLDGEGDKPWEAVRPAVDKWVAMLKERPEGPFFLGREFSYADVYTVTLLKFYQIIDQEVFERLVAHDDVLRKQFEAASPWLERDY